MATSGDNSNGTADDDEWRFSVDEVGEETAEDNESEEREGGNVAGSVVHEESLEPGPITLENAVFFLVGALGTILFIVLAIVGL
jgi:hypothetical protein